MSVEACEHPKVSDGQPCQNTMGLCPKCGHCIAHCEHRADELKEAQRRGGRTTARKRGDSERVALPDEAPAPPETLEDSLHWIAWAAYAVATGTLDTARANTIAKLMSEFRKHIEKSESREALEEIRRQVAELTGDVPELEALP